MKNFRPEAVLLSFFLCLSFFASHCQMDNCSVTEETVYVLLEPVFQRQIRLFCLSFVTALTTQPASISLRQGLGKRQEQEKHCRIRLQQKLDHKPQSENFKLTYILLPHAIK